MPRRMSSSFFSSDRAKSAPEYSPRILLVAGAAGSTTASSLGLKNCRFN